MGRHAALTSPAHAIALLCLCQNDGRASGMQSRFSERCIQLPKIMTTALEPINFGFTHVCHELLNFGVLPKKMLNVVSTIVGTEGLVLPIDRTAQRTQQYVAGIAGKQGVPLTAPQDLDDFPARPVE